MINIKKEIPTICVGYDPRENIGFQVLKYSVLKNTSEPLNVSADDVNTKPGRWLYNFLWLDDQDKVYSKEWLDLKKKIKAFEND